MRTGAWGDWEMRYKGNEKEYMRQYNLEHAEERHIYSKKYREENKERLQAIGKAYRDGHREARAHSSRKRALLIKYDMTPEEYDSMLDRQGGVCLICGRPPKKRRLHVDHEHKTGKIRGLLCFQCNYQVVVVLERYRKRIPRGLLYLEGRLRKPPGKPL